MRVDHVRGLVARKANALAPSALMLSQRAGFHAVPASTIDTPRPRLVDTLAVNLYLSGRWFYPATRHVEDKDAVLAVDTILNDCHYNLVAQTSLYLNYSF
jgi:hypothetical protein